MSGYLEGGNWPLKVPSRCSRQFERFGALSERRFRRWNAGAGNYSHGPKKACDHSVEDSRSLIERPESPWYSESRGYVDVHHGRFTVMLRGVTLTSPNLYRLR